MTDTNLSAVLTRLDTLQAQMNVLLERQRKQEELIDELVMPVAKEALKSLTGTFADLEQKGYFAFGKELVKVGQRIVETTSVDDVKALGEAITTILDTVRTVTQPEVLALAHDATAALHPSEKTRPMGLLGAMRATRDDDVGRGLAVVIELLRRVGQGVGTGPTGSAKAATSRDKVNALLAPRRRATQALPPRIVPRPGNGAAHPPAAAKGPPMVIDGVALGADGTLADPATWTSALAGKIAAAEGVAMTDAHWKVIEFARQDFADRKSSPNIRRITQTMGVETKSLYTLFPKAPARTIAKIAGIPKPAGCL